MRILLVEDERDLADLIAEALRREMFTVDVCYDGEEGMYMALNEVFDVVILDIMLPVHDGWEILKAMREKGINTPILMLTALSDVEYRVKGLNMGADDYLPKPFDLRELIARVKALIRRKTENKNTKLVCDDLVLDTISKKAFRAGKEIDLTRKEYQILEYLMMNKNRVVTKEELQEHLWSLEDTFFSDVLRSHIKNLRKKVDKGFKRRLIHTIRGIGYVIRDE
ncbi:response regulator transcription factor [Thermotoga sp. KOL6]|uniref:response regulator transcription factor n=1 Tax=Thermotoga sp. KOL6 TaxID=126741 RepID=UPI000C76E6CF|nr:response regulator transcription factor [Thermotoga sp. KOL6]PLV59129.1 two-component system response regulator [Thermotoga sp. KOL6]